GRPSSFFPIECPFCSCRSRHPRMSIRAIQDWFRSHQAELTGEVIFDEPLARHTWYRIGGPAAVLCTPRSLDDLRLIARGLSETPVPAFLLGMGSNILASDAGYSGVVIKTGKMNLELSKLSGERIRAGASVLISSFLRRA